MQPLRFRPDGSFRIVQFTDLHWQNDEVNDARSRVLMDQIIVEEQPDLIVFTGDMIHCEYVQDHRAAFMNAVAAASDRHMPWAFVFGNHDAETGITKEQMTTAAQRLPGCAVPLQQAACGIGNYDLPIIGKDGTAHAVLYMLDSGSYAPSTIGAAAWISREQIDWYVQASKQRAAANGGIPLPALAFFHIPLPEFQQLWDFHTCYGFNYEGVGSPRLNSGMFTAMAERGDVRGVFVGHDHLNDYWGTLHGIRLCYGRATGFSGYGQEDMPRGARLIELYEDDRPFMTWLRLENGERIDAQPVHRPVFEDLSVQIMKRLLP
ncbi:metallophosphoesterase family protein [Paenibacillus sp. MMS18-CY102]|uniref:metallophosphoesterase family protein n=1 Tax=Paenibacillus sp. MMS18-CY102 TaxID=2682849 RepID=UPI00136578D2|nr:metallophosphoesterase family protein [Paenibacillus sp. MMS18-CY102]MWC29440.1 metallophosphoesterase [Paenibacillus sp. MMS18-CY102]